MEWGVGEYLPATRVFGGKPWEKIIVELYLVGPAGKAPKKLGRSNLRIDD
jgi:hypothetical protein